MATYCITYSLDSDWNEDVREHFKTRAEADSRLEEVDALGRFARLIRWDNHQPKEMRRINDPGKPKTSS